MYNDIVNLVRRQEVADKTASRPFVAEYNRGDDRRRARTLQGT